MANVNLGDADAAVVIGVWVFDEVIGELYETGALPARFISTTVILGVEKQITVAIDRPIFELATPEGDPPYTRLRLTGEIEVRPLDAEEGTDPELALGLNVAVRLGFVLRPQGEDQAPRLGIEFQGVDGEPTPPVTADQVELLFEDPAVKTILEMVDVPIAQTLIEGLSEARGFTDEDRPRFDEWPVELHLMPGDEENDDALACVVAPPGFDPTPAATASFLPKLTGFSVTFARAFMDVVLAEGAAAKEGEEEDGATITTLNVFMLDDAMFVQGEADGPLGVTVTWQGPAHPQLLRGTTDIVVDSSEIEVEKHGDILDDILVFFGLLFLSGVFVPAVIPLAWKTQEFWEAGKHIDSSGAEAVQGTIATSLGAELDVFASGLAQVNPVGDLTVEATPERLEIIDGSFVLLGQMFVKPLTERIRRARYSRALRRFALYETRSGRTFRASELARLVDAGKIEVPGYHTVDSRFLRSNPNDQRRNNLGVRFQRTGVDEAVA